MNVVFRLPNDDLEAEFLKQSDAASLLNLKGHRSIGGCRASIYNAMPRTGVTALAEFMVAFREINPG
jgi:phosphoserine aminotransferase